MTIEINKIKYFENKDANDKKNNADKVNDDSSDTRYQKFQRIMMLRRIMIIW